MRKIKPTSLGLALMALVTLAVSPAAALFQPFFAGATGGQTQTAATVIQVLVPAQRFAFTHVTAFGYTDGGTAHTLTFLRPLGRTTVVGAAASGQAVVTLAGDPGVSGTGGFGSGQANGIAANDFVVIREKDNVQRIYKVSSVATLAITMTGNLTTGCNGGEDVWFFGITTDTDYRTGSAHPFFTSGAGTALTSWTNSESGVMSTIGKDEPIIVNSNNATAAGKMSYTQWSYTLQ